MDLSTWANAATITAAIAAVGTLFYAAQQIRQNTAVSRGQFWLQLEQMFSSHDEVHLKLRPGGAWTKESGYPQTPEEWAKLEDYMGLFEHCEIMLDAGLIDDRTFIEIFGYRLKNIVANQHIVEEKLIKRREGWTRFHSLLARMKIEVGGPQRN